MKKIIYLLVILAFSATSCIEWGLEELPAYDEVEITDFDLEHRYTSANANGVESVVFTTLNTAVDINSENASITVTPSIPAPTSVFTQDIRRSIALTNIAGYVKLSPAAKIEPLNGAPELGIPGDFSTERQYRVTAADGKTSKVWTISVNPLPIINQYEGEYHATGIDDEGAPFEMDKFLSTVDESISETGMAWYGDWGYTIQIKVLSDNSIEIIPTGASTGLGTAGLTAGKENKYNPSTKTFTLNYFIGPYIFSETLVLK